MDIGWWGVTRFQKTILLNLQPENRIAKGKNLSNLESGSGDELLDDLLNGLIEQKRRYPEAILNIK